MTWWQPRRTHDQAPPSPGGSACQVDTHALSIEQRDAVKDWLRRHEVDPLDVVRVDYHPELVAVTVLERDDVGRLAYDRERKQPAHRLDWFVPRHRIPI